MDRMATMVQQVLPARWEAVTYRSRTHSSATPIDYPALSVQFEQYSEHFLAMQGLTAGDRSTHVLREDRRLRIATQEVTWPVTTFDEVLRADGTHWRVMNPQGGPGYPFWQMQGRRLPPA
jgi:hypothetical protein